MLLGLIIGIGALVGGLVSVIGGAMDAKEEQTAIQEEKALSDTAQAASNDAFNADWQQNMEEARRQAEKMAADEALLREQAQAGFDTSVSALESAYGSNGEMGTQWAGYQNLLIGNASSRGALQAAAGSTGLKNTGTVAQMQQEAATGMAQDEAMAKRSIVAGQNAAISETDQTYKRADAQAGQIASARGYLTDDWANFDWASFTDDSKNPLYAAGGGYKNGGATALRNLYRSRVKANEAGNAITDYRYDAAYKRADFGVLDGFSAFLGGASQGAQIGSQAAGYFGLGGATPKTTSGYETPRRRP